MTDSPAPIEDRAANIKDIVLHIITSKQDEMFDAFDRLHRRNIHDNDLITALRALGETDLLDAYAEWGDIDMREEDNSTLSDVVPDPGNSDTNKLIAESHQIGVVKALIIEQLKAEREKELYFDERYDRDEAMLDGPVNLTDLARAIVKGLGK